MPPNPIAQGSQYVGLQGRLGQQAAQPPGQHVPCTSLREVGIATQVNRHPALSLSHQGMVALQDDQGAPRNDQKGLGGPAVDRLPPRPPCNLACGLLLPDAV